MKFLPVTVKQKFKQVKQQTGKIDANVITRLAAVVRGSGSHFIILRLT